VTTAVQAHFSSGLSVEFQQIEKRYGMRFALRGVSLNIGAGECVALVGANGSGKTTLLKIAALLVRPSAGRVRFSDNGSSPAETPSVKRRIGLVAHNTLLYDELTAEENLVFFARLYGLEDPKHRAAAALEPAGLAPRARDMVRTFSRGMRQRLTIARALLAAPGLLLLDEPATGLDPAGQQWLARVLARLRTEGCTVVMSTHGRSEAHAVVTRAVRLENGRVVEDSGVSGNPRCVLEAMAAGWEE
jgi:heme exporter protein A